MKKRVLFTATVLRGHILVFHLPYMKWFHDRGYEVHLCCRNDTGKAVTQIPWCDRYIEMPFERNPLNIQNLKVAKELKRLIDTEDYSLIHCNTPTGGMLTRICARAARKQGTKVVYTAHGFHFFHGAPAKNWLVYYPAEWLLSRWTDLLITINREDEARAKHFQAKEVVRVNGVGVELSRFEHTKERSFVRKSLGISECVPIAITVGEHSYRKNHETMLRTIAMVKDVHLMLCGVGEREPALKELAKSLNIENRCHFLGFREDIPDLLKASDVFFFTSYQEGLPVALMEAMAAGLPCLASKVRGSMDLLGANEGGFLHGPEDVENYAKDLNRLLSDDKLRLTMGNRNREFIKDYSLESVLQQMGELYTDLLNE